MESHTLSDGQIKALKNGVPVSITRPGQERLEINPPEDG